VTTERALTFADGIATRMTYDLTFAILKSGLDEVVTLAEEEIREGVRAALRLTHNLAEPAGACVLAAAYQSRAMLAGSNVACVMTGGNIDAATLRTIMCPAGGAPS
jgi:threonine dehydratase